MARKGREFEKAYEWLYSLDERFTVTSPAFLYDKAAEEKREVDVLVEYTDAKGLPRKICIECRDRGKPQDVMWIEQLQQKREDLGLDYLDIKKLNARILNRLIEKILVHQRSVDEDGCPIQVIEIFYRFIGKTEIDLYDIFRPAT